ncbi:UDP-N-acetyl-D-glucosamine dehydrogenase [Lentzea xinjiangensis]|uniref:UDP-N-acetyl-D-glucosamine dehydrogenase n=1 Tax=Lentzea xinjiangensis TaxID=402600 RepID=A0A1H9WIU1_9PSEU|nr:nucleotide sugar dehydrogenase [Lentzea xinjiangensis]SES33798.1 UDP-N-acetyl-D-glucosamine dehydrogenase [Lentzea xinjiangensis]
MDIVVVGLGFTGLPTAVAAARAGMAVLGVDASAERVREIAGRRPGCGLGTVAEQELDAAIASARLSLRHNADGIPHAGVYVLCVPTPADRHGRLDVSLLTRAADDVAKAMRPGALVVVQSTCSPGTVEEVLLPRISAVSGLCAGLDFHLAHSPVRTDPGNVAVDTVPRVVAGYTPRCTELAVRFVSRVAHRVVAVSSPRAAELVKIFENTFRMVNISLANELAALCRAQRVDVGEVLEAAGSKPYGFLRHRPGPGAGGDCIPVSAGFFTASARRHGLHSPVVEAAIAVNNAMPAHTVHRVREALAARGLPPLRRSRVLVAGVTYKPDTANVRQSAAVRVINELAAEADVAYHDPYVPTLVLDDGSTLTSQPVGAPADIVLVMTKHAAHEPVRRDDVPVFDCSSGDPVEVV